MTSDARITSSNDGAENQNSEPNSLREVLLFCTVLLVEVYSLAVSFGGPFFEVGYFLLVVVSQTFAGAYIWAQLRRTDETLPLPELLAMGFAIGSASAAISQLIVRDLLGIRLFISPLIPIIGVAIWLVTKRNARLPVQITHATTNTLLWLLFPAPLALSFFVWELYAIFVIPLFISSFLYRKNRIKSFYPVVFIVAGLSFVLGLIIQITNSISIAIGIIGGDEIFDEAIAIGFSNWTINSHIGRVGDTFAYYKLGHVWLGPILELTRAPSMIISTSVLPLTIFTFVGLALWTTSHQIFKSRWAAGIASVLFFLQSSFPEPENVAIRIAQCLVVVYFLTGVTAIIKTWSSDIKKSFVTAIVTFLIFATRAQYGLIFLLGISINELLLLRKRITSLPHFVSLMTAIVISLAVCFLIFYNQPAHAAGAPNIDSISRLFVLFFSYVALRSFIPLVTSHQQSTEQSHLLLSIIGGAILIFFTVPQTALANAPSLIIALSVSVLVTRQLIRLPFLLTKIDLIVISFSATFLGIAIRVFYDFYKWSDLTGLNIVVKFFAIKAIEDESIALVATIPFLVLTFLVLIIRKSRRGQANFRNTALLTSLTMSLGISIAVVLRPIVNNFRYGIKIQREVIEDSPMSWYTSPERLAALEWMRTNTNRDDIFAQNTSTPEYRTSAYSASLILGGSIHRRAFIEGTYGPELQYDYPRDVKLQTPRLKEQLQRLDTSFYFPISPSTKYLNIMRAKNVKWFVVDLGNTPLRNWEPFAKTRFMNEKVAILELNYPDDDNS